MITIQTRVQDKQEFTWSGHKWVSSRGQQTNTFKRKWMRESSRVPRGARGFVIERRNSVLNKDAE